MIHPLLRLAATQPHLLGDHVEAYAALVGEEAQQDLDVAGSRASAFTCGALALFAIGLVLIGVALMLLRDRSAPTTWRAGRCSSSR